MTILPPDEIRRAMAIRDAEESESHLCNSLNAMYGLCTRLGHENSDTLVPIKSSTLYTIGLYLERAQNLITYLQNERKGV